MSSLLADRRQLLQASCLSPSPSLSTAQQRLRHLRLCSSLVALFVANKAARDRFLGRAEYHADGNPVCRSQIEPLLLEMHVGRIQQPVFRFLRDKRRDVLYEGDI
jgi:hypothetical protein